MFLSWLQNNVRAKIFGKIRRHASAYFWTHCGRIGLEVHAIKLTVAFEFFNVLLEYLHRSWCPWSLLGHFCCRFRREGRFSLIFHVAASLPHLSELIMRLSLVLSSTTGSSSSRYFREMSTLLSSDCSKFCSNDLDSTKRRKYFPGFHACVTLSSCKQALSVRVLPTKWDPFRGVWVLGEWSPGNSLSFSDFPTGNLRFCWRRPSLMIASTHSEHRSPTTILPTWSLTWTIRFHQGLTFLSSNEFQTDIFSLTFPWVAVDCGQPQTLRNGSIVGVNTVFPSVMYLSCHEGFLLRGASQIQCEANGSWSKNSSFCEGNFFICYPQDL